MSLAFYKVIHLFGIALLFTGVGGLCILSISGSDSVKARRLSSILHGLALVMERNLSKHGIRINDVLPGAVDTPLKVANVEDMHDAGGKAGNLEAKIDALVSPDDISKIHAFLMSRGGLRD